MPYAAAVAVVTVRHRLTFVIDAAARIAIAGIAGSRYVIAFEPERQNFGKLCGNLLLDRVANVTPCFFPLSNYEAFAPFYVHRTAQAAISQLHFHALDTPAHLKHMQVSGFRVEGLRAKR